MSFLFNRLDLILIVLLIGHASGENVHCAVAANFTAATKEINHLFEKSTEHRITVSFGSTGQLYSQIVNGASFDIMLAADISRPEKLESSGLAVSGTRFTYAQGVLVLWSPNAALVDSAGAVLASDTWRYCAIANPRTAPYGAVAQQVLMSLGLWKDLQQRLVQGTNIAQVWQQVASGNADMGFVAFSQIALLPPEKKGSYWIVADTLYEPLQQQAILLKRGENNKGARDFLTFLKGPEARAIIFRYGYVTGALANAD
jgi:molybdate transport system substrate-binding protein